MLERLQQFAKNPNVQAFLRVIRHCEGTADDDGYRRMFGGKLFDSFDDHPRQAQTFKLRKGGTLTSTAAGAYQFLARTWDALVKRYGFTDFSPQSQDLAAIALIDGRGALMDLVRGDLESAVRKCAREWASLPGSPYGQPTKSVAEVRRVYEQHGGQYSSAGPKEKQMVAPFVAAALPAVINAVPALIDIFKGDGKVAQRNAEAAKVVVGIAKDALGAANEQEMVEKLQSDPDAQRIVREAIEREWFQISEAGGGGIKGAREANLRQPPPGRNMALWVTAALLPLVYMTVAAVLFLDKFSDDMKAMVIGTVVSGTLAAIVAYWLGSSFGSQRKTDLIAAGGESAT